MKKNCLLILIFIGFVSSIQSQTICGATAVALTPGTAQCGTSTTGGSFPDNATAPTNPCDNFYNDGEYWFKFTGTGAPLTLALSGLTNTYGGLFVFDNCPSSSPTCIASITNGSSTANLNLTTPSLTSGTVYYIAIVNWGTPNTNSFCLSSTVVSAPANDDCAGATTLTVGASCTYTATTNSGATTSSTAGTPAPGCSSYTGGDVWFKFVVPAGGEVKINTNTGGILDGGMAWYTGSCGALTLLECDDDDSENGSMPMISRSGLTPGSTIYVRFWEYGNDNNGTFSICASTPAVSGCSSASALACATSNLSGTTVGTTAAVNGTGCFLSDYGKWYTFTGDGQQTTISSTATGGFDHEMAIMSGSCASLTNISCNDNGGTNGNESYTFNTVNGTNYYVYIADYSSGSTTTGTFTISRSCGASTSGCSSATNLPCGTSSLAGTTVGAVSAVDGTGCTLSSYGKWYTFAGNDQQTTINVLGGASFDTEIAIASGSCALLTNISCTDNQLSGANENVSFFANLGTTYYVYVAYYGASGTSSDTGPFTITRNCGAVVAATGNQDCSNARQLCSDQSFEGNSDGDGITDLDATNEGCATENQSSWYFFSPVTAGTLNFTIQTNVDYDFAIWGPFPTKTCPIATTPVRCSFAAEYGVTGLNTVASDVSEDSGGDRWVSPLNVAAADVNKVYVMLIDNFWSTSDPFTIDFNMTNGLTLNCTPLPIDLVNFLGFTKENKNHLKWMTSSERDNDYFIIERSNDGENWSELKKIKGAGNSMTQQNYSFIDNEFKPSENYYRLSQVDFNGQKKEFNIVLIDNSNSEAVLLYRTNTIGQKIDEDYKGLIFEIYSDGSIIKKIK